MTTQGMPTTPPADKLLGLEALRFIAAFAVMIWHYQHFSYVRGVSVGLVNERLPLYGLLQPFYEAGGYGVWIFWCISGFIFFWKYRDPIADRTIGGWTFFVFRLSRLYPLHFMTLIAVALLQPIYFHLHGFFFVYGNNDLQHFIPQLFMASDWGLDRSNSFNGPIWSISVEVLVYAFFFSTLRFATRSPLFNLFVIVACLNFVAQFCSCLAFFYAGGLAAIGRQAISQSRFRIPIETALWCAVTAAPLAMWLFALRDAVVPWIFLLGYVPILLFCLADGLGLPAFIRPLVEAVGNMTYSSYLLHFPIQLLMVLGFASLGQPVPYYDGSFFFTFVAVTLLASYFTYRYFEAPAQAFIRSHLLARSSRLLTEPRQ